MKLKNVIAGGIVLIGITAYINKGDVEAPTPVAPIIVPKHSNQAVFIQANEPNFKCDGRQHCSEMTSLEEARFFLKNCPNTKMDGDNDGEPCERQF